MTKIKWLEICLLLTTIVVFAWWWFYVVPRNSAPQNQWLQKTVLDMGIKDVNQVNKPDKNPPASKLNPPQSMPQAPEQQFDIFKQQYDNLNEQGF